MAEQRDELAKELVREFHRYFIEARLVAHAFADRHGLHATDLHALLEVMTAEGRGAPLTPGRLAEQLGLSSGATTAVIDRLERLGHIRRARDEGDRRRVYLRRDEDGMALAKEFFGSLGERSDAVLAGFDDQELAVAYRFLTEMTDAVAAHRRDVTSEHLNSDAGLGGARP